MGSSATGLLIKGSLERGDKSAVPHASLLVAARGSALHGSCTELARAAYGSNTPLAVLAPARGANTPLAFLNLTCCSTWKARGVLAPLAAVWRRAKGCVFLERREDEA
jgi:hypothetical protein